MGDRSAAFEVWLYHHAVGSILTLEPDGILLQALAQGLGIAPVAISPRPAAQLLADRQFCFGWQAREEMHRMRSDEVIAPRIRAEIIVRNSPDRRRAAGGAHALLLMLLMNKVFRFLEAFVIAPMIVIDVALDPTRPLRAGRGLICEGICAVAARSSPTPRGSTSPIGIIWRQGDAA